MKKYGVAALVVVAALGLTACGKENSNKAASGNTPAKAAEAGKMIAFAATQDGKPIDIKSELFDTPQAKEFAATGKNPYVGNDEAIVKGKKLFQLYSCTQCHGGDAQGQTGPSLQGPDFKYAKNATNKGMFETIWHGTNGGMGAKGKGLMDPSDPNNGLTPDEALKIIAWVRTHGKTTGNE